MEMLEVNEKKQKVSVKTEDKKTQMELKPNFSYQNIKAKVKKKCNREPYYQDGENRGKS